MEITQVNRHQQYSPSKENLPPDPTQLEQPSFAGELVFAEKKAELFSPFRSDHEGSKELEEQIEEKRRDEDLEKSFAMAFLNNQKLENLNQQQNLEKEFSFNLVRQETGEKSHGQQAAVAQSLDTKRSNHEVIQDKTAIKKAHLVTPLAQQNMPPEELKSQFAELVSKNLEEIKQNLQTVNNGTSASEKSLEGDPLKQLLQPTQVKADPNRQVTRLDSEAGQGVKPNADKASSLKQSLSEFNLGKEQSQAQLRPERNKSATNKQFSTELNAVIKDNPKTETSQAAKQAQEKSFQETNVKEITNNLRIMLSSGKDAIIIRLAPEHLGKLEIRLKKNAETFSGEFKVESKEARDLLKANLAQLHQELESQGIKIEEFSFIIQGDQEGSFNQNFAQEGQGEQNPSLASSPSARTESLRGEEALEAPLSSRFSNEAGLNILA